MKKDGVFENPGFLKKDGVFENPGITYSICIKLVYDFKMCFCDGYSFFFIVNKNTGKNILLNEMKI